MSSTVSSVPSVKPKTSITSDYGSEGELNATYSLMKCRYHLKKRCVQPMPGRQLLVKELADFFDWEIEGAVCGRTRPFHNAIREFREENSEVKLFCSPLTFYCQRNQIRVEIGRGECFCKHVFHVEKENFYALIRDAKVSTLDIQIEHGAHDMFEFLAYNLPGIWCRELRALNVVFADKSCVEPLSTLLKKSRGVSRLRVAQTSGEVICVSDLVKSMGSLEELELNCPDNSGSGFLFDKGVMKAIVELEKRTGATKPFRQMKAFNAQFDFSAKEFIHECYNLSNLNHNETYSMYETLNEIRGKGGFDLDNAKNCVNFEFTPSLTKKLEDELFMEMASKSKSYLVQYNSTDITRRHYLINGSLFRLVDHD
uniref:Uncharacterized protein n=1 Tax=Caenorhabditis japonica TaxID=281687 RepID=A0A8R1HPK5_CAEJA